MNLNSILILFALGNTGVIALAIADDTCPKTGNTKLPETYPVKAYVVSQDNGPDPNFAKNLVLQILKSSEVTPPKIILQVNTAQYENILEGIKEETRSDHHKSKLWLKSLQHSVVPSGYAWQQDYFESFVDSKSGKPEIRIIRDSMDGFGSWKTDRGFVNHQARAIQKTAENNDWIRGEDLTLKNLPIKDQATRAAIEEAEREGKDFVKLSSKEQQSRIQYQTQIMERHMVNNLTGGNIEGLPGGLCLRGNNQPSSYTAMYCGGKSNEVVVDTSWLSVGHVDEIIQVVKKPNAKSPCDFAIAYASPAKALELLRGNGSQNFFEGFSQRPGVNFSKRFDPRNNANQTLNPLHPAYPVCIAVSCVQKQNPADEFKVVVPAASSRPIYWLEVIFERRANAGIKVTRSESQRVSEAQVCDQSCKPNDILSIKNSEVFEAFQKDSNLRVTNQLIEEKMLSNKKAIETKLKERLPQCVVDFIELPELFYHESQFQAEMKSSDCKTNDISCYRLPVRSMHSIHPNPANAITVDRTILTPHPQNSIFAKYIENAYLEKAGMKTSFIDTYDDLHLVQGNLHCATHVINYCIPR